MKASELGTLSARLNELAEYYGAKQPTNAALKVWLDALSEAPITDVLSALTDWPKSRPRFPLASELLTVVRDKISERVERQAATDRASAPKMEEALALAGRYVMSEVGKAEMAKIRAILRAPKRRISGADTEAEEERRAIQAEGAPAGQ